MLPILTRVMHASADELRNLKPRLILVDLLVALLPSLCFVRVRTALYRMAGLNIGPRTSVFGRLTLAGPGRAHQQLHIGADCIINAPLFLDLTGEIHIGDRVSIGHHTVFVTTHHDIGTPDFRAGPSCGRAIVIEDGSWIAARSTILPGVTVGHSSVVASGAVVAGSVPANSLVGGVPARVIRELPVHSQTPAPHALQ